MAKRSVRRPPGRPRAGRGPAVDRQTILDAAVRLVEDAGLDGLTMRRLAAEVGLEVMSLYHYFPSKAAVLDGVADSVLGDLRVKGGQTDSWQTTLREVARSFRRLARTHPRTFPLLATLGLDSPAGMRATEAVVRALAATGLDPQLAYLAFVSVRSYVIGHSLWVIHRMQRSEADTSAEFAEADFPYLARLGPAIARLRGGAAFETGLDFILKGIEQQVRTARQ